MQMTGSFKIEWDVRMSLSETESKIQESARATMREALKHAIGQKEVQQKVCPHAQALSLPYLQ
jgi:hypothetical protein